VSTVNYAIMRDLLDYLTAECCEGVCVRETEDAA